MNSLLLGSTVLAMVVNTILIVGIAWRGGRLLGNMEEKVNSIGALVARLIDQFDALERRVGVLEGRH